MAEQTFFITGATGLLGTEVVSCLLSTTDGMIYVLVRAGSEAEAAQRLQGLWWEDRVLSEAVGQRVLPVVGDITEEMSKESSDVLNVVTHFIHCAAETGVQKSKDELWRINVEGTRHMVQLAGSLPRLQRFTYVSTAYVAGTRSGCIKEDDDLPTRF